MRTFIVFRSADPTGVSGVGVVAEGIEFHDGTVAMRWRGMHRSTVVWKNLGEAVAIHGHDGRTEFRILTLTCPTCQMTIEHPVDKGSGYCVGCHEMTSIPWVGQ